MQCKRVLSSELIGPQSFFNLQEKKGKEKLLKKMFLKKKLKNQLKKNKLRRNLIFG